MIRLRGNKTFHFNCISTNQNKPKQKEASIPSTDFAEIRLQKSIQFPIYPFLKRMEIKFRMQSQTVRG